MKVEISFKKVESQIMKNTYCPEKLLLKHNINISL